MTTTKNQQLRIAVIGCGKMGSYHVNAIREIMAGKQEIYYKGGVGEYLSRIFLDAMVDPSFEKPRSNKLGTHFFPNCESMLKKLTPDAAIVATPTTTHFNVASTLLQRGIPLLIEKPVADSTMRIRELKKIAEAHNAFILPGHVERYNPAAIEISEILRHKLYGKPLSYSFTRTSPRPRRIPDNIMIDKLVHDIDLLISFFGKPKIEDAFFKRDKKGIVTECELRLRHPKGIRGTLLSSWQIKKKERSFSIHTEDADLHGDFLKKRLRIDRKSEYSKTVQAYANNQLRDQLADFIAGSFGLWPPLVSIDDAINSAQVVDKTIRLAEFQD